MDDVFDTQPDEKELARRRRVTSQRAGDDNFLRNCLKSRAGRDYFWRLMEFCHIAEISWVQGSFDATAFREGQRNVGQKLLGDIGRVSPEAYILMMQERNQKPETVESEQDER